MRERDVKNWNGIEEKKTSESMQDKTIWYLSLLKRA